MAKNAVRTSAVKQSLRSPPKESPKLAIAEARRSAALHAARVARAEIQAAERHLHFTAELGGLIEAIKHRHERYRAYLVEAVELGHGRLEEALDELRACDLMAVHAGGRPLGEAEVEPWAPSHEVEELLALAKRPGGAR